LAVIIELGLFALALKGLWDLINNWGNMTGDQKQEAVAEIIGGLLVGGLGPKKSPRAGSVGPKGGSGPPPVAVTPEGIPMPVPERGPTAPSGPAAEGPMEMSGGGGGNRRPEVQRGPGGGQKHESHGTASDDSGPGQRRKAEKQEKARETQLSEAQAEQQARAELEAIRQKLGDNNFKTWLGKQTEEAWIRNRQLELLGRR
jgi:hypothetical protein